MHLHLCIDHRAPVDHVWRVIEAIDTHTEWMTDAETITFPPSNARASVPSSTASPESSVQHGRRMRVTEWEPQAVRASNTTASSRTGRFTLLGVGNGTHRVLLTEDLVFPTSLGGGAAERLARPGLRTDLAPETSTGCGPPGTLTDSADRANRRREHRNPPDNSGGCGPRSRRRVGRAEQRPFELVAGHPDPTPAVVHRFDAAQRPTRFSTVAAGAARSTTTRVGPASVRSTRRTKRGRILGRVPRRKPSDRRRASPIRSIRNVRSSRRGRCPKQQVTTVARAPRVGNGST